MFREINDYLVILLSGQFNTRYYLYNYPDVRRADVSPLVHYVKYGWREGRNPSSQFNTTYYIEANPDVKAADINPLAHFIRYGKREGRLPVAKYYCTTKPKTEEKIDKKTSDQLDQATKTKLRGEIKGNYLIAVRGIEYLRIYGFFAFLRKVLSKLGSCLSQKNILINDHGNRINTSIYGELYKDYLKTATGIIGHEYISYEDYKDTNLAPIVKLIAFYLPQFHPIQENDSWWGKGFTEWTNVSKATPQYVGHYQPHLPGELGFYDLRIPEIQRRQVELAKNYGVYGFCFHYYWFDGKRLLEKPLFQFLNDSEIDFPFCICWANENWTRRWDGQDKEILIGQVHTLEIDKRFIEDLEPILRHPNYIKINNRPLIIIYRVTLLNEPQKTFAYWRQFCLDHGLGNPLIVAAQTFGFTNPVSVGCDAAVEFPPHNVVIENITSKMQILNDQYSGAIYDYRKLVSHNINPLKIPYKVYRTAAPSWDNEARMPGRGHSFAFSSPKIYQRWLEEICYGEILEQVDGERLVFVNAWNEWAEGAYLEPDRKFGYAYLQATRDALDNISQKLFINARGDRFFKPPKSSNTAVILHAYHFEMLEEIKMHLNNLGNDFDLYISIPENNYDMLDDVFKYFPNANVLVMENRGRDIAPFIEIYRSICNLGYLYLLKIHTKKSSHRSDGDAWRNEILSNLTSPKSAFFARDTLNSDPKLGIVGPKGHILNSKLYWGYNKELTLDLAKRIGISTTSDPEFEFVAGSMYWAKPDALRFLNILPLGPMDYEPEPIFKDGMLPHAMERFIGMAIKAGGYKIKEIDKDGNIGELSNGEGFEFAQIFPQ